MVQLRKQVWFLKGAHAPALGGFCPGFLPFPGKVNAAGPFFSLPQPVALRGSVISSHCTVGPCSPGPCPFACEDQKAPSLVAECSALGAFLGSAQGPMASSTSLCRFCLVASSAIWRGWEWILSLSGSYATLSWPSTAGRKQAASSRLGWTLPQVYIQVHHYNFCFPQNCRTVSLMSCH